MKKEHRLILNKIEKYLGRPGAEHLRFWQALYNLDITRGEWDAKTTIMQIKDDHSVSDEDLLKRIKG